MSIHPAIVRTLQRQPALGALLYGAVLLACVASNWLTIAHLLEQRANLASATSSHQAD